MTLDKLFRRMFRVDRLIESNEERFVYYCEEGNETMVYLRVKEIECKLAHPGYVIQLEAEPDDIRAFVQIEGGWYYLKLNYEPHLGKVRFMEIKLKEKGVELYKGNVLDSVKSHMYDYFTELPAYRLKVTTGLIQRKG